jgi:hypothetical protein
VVLSQVAVGCLAHLKLIGKKGQRSVKTPSLRGSICRLIPGTRATLAYIMVPPLTREVIENSPFSSLIRSCILITSRSGL